MAVFRYVYCFWYLVYMARWLWQRWRLLGKLSGTVLCRTQLAWLWAQMAQSWATWPSFWCLCENSFKKRQKVPDRWRREHEEWETTVAAAPRSEEQGEGRCSMAGQITTKQPVENPMPKELGVSWRKLQLLFWGLTIFSARTLICIT